MTGPLHKAKIKVPVSWVLTWRLCEDSAAKIIQFIGTIELLGAGRRSLLPRWLTPGATLPQLVEASLWFLHVDPTP